MKTIEERADKYCKSQGLYRGACASQVSYGASCMYEGYIQGATEQKAIDDAEGDTSVYNLLMLKLDAEKGLWLNKACEAYCQVCKERDTDCFEYCKGLHGKAECNAITDFRKAMIKE